jgi:hypothetical protein
MCKPTGTHRSDRAESASGATSRTPARRHASPTRRRRAPPYHGRSLEFGREPGVRQRSTRLQVASRPENPRATRRARARRGAIDPPARRGPPYRAITRRSLRRETNLPRRARIGYKSPQLWLPLEHTAIRCPPLPPPP